MACEDLVTPLKLAAWITRVLEETHSIPKDNPIQVCFVEGDPWRLVILRAYPLYMAPPKKGYARLASIGGDIDYHTELYALLNTAIEALEQFIGNQPRKLYVDKDGGDDRLWPFKGGLTFYGKHNLAISPGLGSALNIGSAALALDSNLENEWRKALEGLKPLSNGCGTCKRCIEACPTRALTEGVPLNTQRCRSAINQSKGDLSPEIGAQIADWLYGCDICQLVCPYNQKRLTQGGLYLPISAFEAYSNKQFKSAYGHRAFAYLGLKRLNRNMEFIKTFWDHQEA